MVTFPDDSEISSLKDLWKACFPEDSEFCDFYFEHCFRNDHCLVYSGESGIESAFYWFDGFLNTGTQRLPVIFLYAGATYKQYRSKGNIYKMFEKITEYCRQRNIAAFVLSALNTSKGVSERFGLSPDIVLRETVVKKPSCSNCEIKPQKCSLEDFKRLRKISVDDCENSIGWSDYDLEFMYRELNFSGEIISLELDGKKHYAVISEDEEAETLLVKETDVPADKLQLLAESVFCFKSDYKAMKILTRPNDIPDCLETESSRLVYYAHVYYVLDTPEIKAAREKGELYINLTAE